MDCFLFDGLNDTEYKSIAGLIGSGTDMEKGCELYRCGYIGILSFGTAHVCRRGETGETVVMRMIGKGEVFGAASVFGTWKEGSSSITAAAICKVIYISEDDLRRIMTEYPAVALNYIGYLSDKIRFLNRRIDMFSAGSAVGKVYEYIVTTADERLMVGLPRETSFSDAGFGMAELARRLKCGRTSLYRAVDSLESSGLISRAKGGFRLICGDMEAVR